MYCLRITRWVALLAAALWVAACGSSSGSVAPVDAPDELGSYAVGHTFFQVVDAARGDRELPVDVWYPVDAADAMSEPRTEYVLPGGFMLPSDVAVDDLAHLRQAFLERASRHSGPQSLAELGMKLAISAHQCALTSEKRNELVPHGLRAQ